MSRVGMDGRRVPKTSRDGIPYGCFGVLVFQSSKCWVGGKSFGRIFEAAFILGDVSRCEH